MEIGCTFRYSDKLYGCFIENHQIPDDKNLQLNGTHGPEETNNDVSLLNIIYCTMPLLPREFMKFFPNLKTLEIKYSKLVKLCNEDIAEYKKLEKIDCSGNQITFLSGDLFDGLKNLERIVFNNNKLEIIEPNILDRSEKLKYAEFRKNANYDTGTDCTDIRIVKDTLCTKFFSLQSADHNLFLRKYKLSITDIKRYVNQCGNSNEIRNEIWKQQHEYLQKTYADNIHVMKKTEVNLRKRVQYFENFGENLMLDLKAFIQNEDTKDFKIVINDHEFSVHKFLLAARSPTLAELLKSNPEVENLNLVDISVEIFEKVLKFLYTDELPDDNETNFLHLFAAAGKLKIKKLQNFASTKLMNNFDVENAIEIFKLSFKYGDDDLRLKAFEEIKKTYNKIDLKDELSTDPEKVSKIIDMYLKKEEVMRKLEEEFEKSVSKIFEDNAYAREIPGNPDPDPDPENHSGSGFRESLIKSAIN